MASSAIFSGSSRYANDFSQVIERSVALASLPITQLGSQRSKLVDQSAALTGLAGKLSSVRTSLASINDAKSAIQVNSSDGATVGASAELTAFPGSYKVDVISTGSRTMATSKDSLSVVSDYTTQSISTADSFRLTVDGTAHDIVPKANTLASLAEAINAESTYGVQAVIVNLGSSAAPSYKLSLQSTSLGPIALQLEELDADPETLLTEVTQGSLASYRINGQPAGAPLTSDKANAVSIAPGLTVDLLKTGSADVVVSANRNKLSMALSSLASAYNSAMAETDKHRGDSNSALNSHTILSSVAQSLRRVLGHSSSGSIQSAEQLGFSFSDSGVLSFDASRFDSLSLSSVSEFLGSPEGGGFLTLAEDVLDTLDGENVGLLPTTIASVSDQIASTDRQVIANQERIDLLRQRLASQMATADALIGMLEQQVNYMNGLFEAMRINAKS